MNDLITFFCLHLIFRSESTFSFSSSFCYVILCKNISYHFCLEVRHSKVSQHGVQRSHKKGRPGDKKGIRINSQSYNVMIGSDQSEHGAGQADDDGPSGDSGPGGAEHGRLQEAVREVHHLQGPVCAVGED